MGLFIGRILDAQGNVRKRFKAANQVTDQGAGHEAMGMWHARWPGGISTQSGLLLTSSYLGLTDINSFFGFSTSDRAYAPGRAWTEITSYRLPNVSNSTALRAEAKRTAISAAYATMEIAEYPEAFDQTIWNASLTPRSTYINQFSFAASVGIAGFFLTNVQTKSITFSDTPFQTFFGLYERHALIATASQPLTFAQSELMEVIYLVHWKAAHRTY